MDPDGPPGVWLLLSTVPEPYLNPDHASVIINRFLYHLVCRRHFLQPGRQVLRQCRRQHSFSGADLWLLGVDTNHPPVWPLLVKAPVYWRSLLSVTALHAGTETCWLRACWRGCGLADYRNPLQGHAPSHRYGDGHPGGGASPVVPHAASCPGILVPPLTASSLLIRKVSPTL